MTKYLLFLKHNHPISLHVSHIDSSPKLNDDGVFFRHEPADMAEEKSTLRVVRITVGVGVAVMQAVIATPDEH